MTTFVVDASVAVRWLVEMPGHEQARSLLTWQHHLIAPDLLVAEVGNVLAKLVRGKALSRKEGREALDDFFRAPVRLLPGADVAARAMDLAMECGQGFYDCLYLALAERERGAFVTADQRFVNAMAATRHAGLLQPLGMS